MALIPLSRVQQATVVALVDGQRLAEAPVDSTRATSFMRQAEERLGQLGLLTSAAVRYGIAYDAAHDVGEAVLAGYGFRTANGPGQHEALGRYQAKPVGAAAADQAADVARTLFDAAVARGVTP